MNRTALALALTLTAGFGAAACVNKQSMALDRAEEEFSCPRQQIALTDLGEGNFSVAGCGKKDTLYCYLREENQGQANQHGQWVCEPTSQVLGESQHADTCADECNSAGLRCMEQCGGDDACRDGCQAMSDGCFKGCTGN
jgi:hypothetical protein